MKYQEQIRAVLCCVLWWRLTRLQVRICLQVRDIIWTLLKSFARIYYWHYLGHYRGLSTLLQQITNCWMVLCSIWCLSRAFFIAREVDSTIVHDYLWVHFWRFGFSWIIQIVKLRTIYTFNVLLMAIILSLPLICKK